MPTVTINIVGRGTLIAGGSPSQVGHMRYSLDNGNGERTSYGFAPDENHHGDPFAPGEIYHNDDTTYIGARDYIKTIEVTQKRYDGAFCKKTFDNKQ